MSLKNRSSSSNGPTSEPHADTRRCEGRVDVHGDLGSSSCVRVIAVVSTDLIDLSTELEKMNGSPLGAHSMCVTASSWEHVTRH